MANSTETRVKLLAAIQTDTRTQEVAQDEIARAKADAAAAKAAWHAAELRFTVVRGSREQDIANIAARRTTLSSLIATPEADPARVEALLQPYQLPPNPIFSSLSSRPAPPAPTVPSLVAVHTAASQPHKFLADTDSSSLLTDLGRSSADESSEEDDNDDIATEAIYKEGRYLFSCSAIAQNDNDQWVEIRCSVCGLNSDPTRKGFFKGRDGIQRHLRQSHGQRTTRAIAIAQCTHRVVPLSEVKKLASGARTLQKITTDIQDGQNPANRRRSIKRKTVAPEKDRSSNASLSTRESREGKTGQTTDTRSTPPSHSISRRSTKHKLGQTDPRHGLTTDSLKYLKLLTGSKTTAAARKFEEQKASKVDRDRFRKALQEKKASVAFNTSPPLVARVAIPGASGAPYIFWKWDAEGQASYQAREAKVVAAEAKAAEREAQGYEVPESDQDDDSDLSSEDYVGRRSRADSLLRTTDTENGKKAASESDIHVPNTIGISSSSEDDTIVVQDQRAKGKRRAAEYAGEGPQDSSKRPRRERS